ncbi:hypothetical protein EC957_008494 [Mortierella hygrophila]|uniref:Uncharacterized protein n=1 Tax=Mortierella hygrophila TaxID=979708 RepID=A0A9P6JY39_9FUNG|nr:hypothetical protein EC957_008494 [Mortierella hygrophila]
MSEHITDTSGLDTRAELDARLVRESRGNNNTVHGIPPFTVPRADGTLEVSPDIQGDIPGTATARMMRRRQQQQQGGHVARGDHDGDGDQTNLQGYRDGRDKNKNEDGSSGDNRSQGKGGLAGAYMVGSATRRPLLQRVRKAFMPTLIGGLIAWWYDAVGVLIYRNDPRIKGYLLTFSLLCLSIMLSIFFYLEFIRPKILKKPTVYVNWEKELLYPVRVATISLILGTIGANIALWPVWHLSTGFVLLAVAIATVNVLGIFI